jgi:hypothetical protein
MKAIQVIPTHGFLVQCTRSEFFEVLAKNKLTPDSDGNHYLLSDTEHFRNLDQEKATWKFFLGLDGTVDLRENGFLDNENDLLACRIEPFEFRYLQHLIVHHDKLLMDPNVQKALFASNAKVPTRIIRNKFCGWSDFSALGSSPEGNYEGWDDDTLAWQILRQMENTIGNEANTFNELESHWYERRDNYLSINPRFFPSYSVTLSELRARRKRADGLIQEYENLINNQFINDDAGEYKLRSALEKLDDDTVLEICFLDFHNGNHWITKIAGDVFLSRLPDTQYLFN